MARPALLVQLELARRLVQQLARRLAQLELAQLELAQLELAPRLVQRLAQRLAQLELAQLELAQLELAQLELAQLELAQLELALALARELWAENLAELLDWRATESQQWQEKQKLKSKAQG